MPSGASVVRASVAVLLDQPFGERAFGLGGSILAEAVQFVSGQLEFEAA